MKGKKFIKKKGGANLVPPPGIDQFYNESIDNNTGIRSISFGEELLQLWDYNNIIKFLASNLNIGDIIEYAPQNQHGIQIYEIYSINENGKRIIYQIYDGQEPDMEPIQWEALSNFSYESSNENIDDKDATMPYNPFNQSQQMGGLKKKTKKRKKKLFANYLVKAFTIQNKTVSGGEDNGSGTKIILPSKSWIIKNVKLLLANSQDIRKNYKEINNNIMIIAIKKKDHYILIINQPKDYISPLNAMYFNDDIHNQNIKYYGKDVNIEIGKKIEHIKKTIKKFYY